MWRRRRRRRRRRREYNRIVVVVEYNRTVVVVVVVEYNRIVVVAVEYLESVIFLHRSHPLQILFFSGNRIFPNNELERNIS